jgi:hypothetical protein
MTVDAPHTIGQWFLEAVRYDIETLVVTLTTTADGVVEVVFSPPREFRCFAESDAWEYLRHYAGRELVTSIDRGCGIVVCETAGYLLDYRSRVRPQEPEATFACLIKTPQECVEVICFEDPEIRWG